MTFALVSFLSPQGNCCSSQSRSKIFSVNAEAL
jgi:hypothetical protein